MCENSNVQFDSYKTFSSGSLSLPTMHFYFNKPYNRITHIAFYTQSKRLLQTIIHCSLYTISSFVLGGSTAYPWSLRSLPLPYAFYKSMYLEVIAKLHFNNHDGVIHACVLKACVSSK